MKYSRPTQVLSRQTCSLFCITPIYTQYILGCSLGSIQVAVTSLSVGCVMVSMRTSSRAVANPKNTQKRSVHSDSDGGSLANNPRHGACGHHHPLCVATIHKSTKTKVGPTVAAMAGLGWAAPPCTFDES